MKRAVRLAPLIGLLVLASCATPLERCVAQARGSLTAAEEELREAERTLARGYAIEYRLRSIPYYATCSDGDGGRYPCISEQTQRVPKPVPVNLAQVRQRADEIRRDLPGLRRSADAGAAQCRQLHAESLSEQG